LDSFLETFEEEPVVVQLQLLTSTVKLFLKQPATTQDMVQRVLNLATEESDNPDLRDRGYVYWRLLSSNPDAAKAVVLAEKPTIADDTEQLEPELLQMLVGDIATLASIYHKPASAFVMKSSQMRNQGDDEDDEEFGDDEDEYGEDDSSGESSSYAAGGGGGGGDLLDMLDTAPPPLPPAAAANPAGDLFGAPAPAAAVPAAGGDASGGPPCAPKGVVCPAQQGNGVQVAAVLKRDGLNGPLVLEMDITNQTPTPLQNLAVQLNKSSFGLTVQGSAQVDLPVPLQQGQTSAPYKLTLGCTPGMLSTPGPEGPTATLQVAMKNMHSGGVFYFAVPVPVACCLLKPSPLDPTAFKAKWQAIDKASEQAGTATPLPGGGDIAATAAFCGSRLGAAGMGEAVAPFSGPDGVTRAYRHALTATNVLVLVELSFKAGFPGAKVTVRSDQAAFAGLLKASVEQLLKL
jgi:AP-1 complex subunit beta-1